jgi:hypothetical protein
MADKKIIDVAALTEAAKQYDPILRTLPFFSLEACAAALGLNIQEVENEHVVVNRRRQAGSTGPYKAGMTITYQEEIAKFFESNLKPELVVSKTKDNITNYKEKKVLVAAGTPLDLKAKVHPLQQMIVEDEVKSHAEDVVFSLFFAERNEDVFSPATAFTGFFPAMDMLVTEGFISSDLGNLQVTGAFAEPASDTDYLAYEHLVDFVGSAHPLLRSSIGGKPQLLITQTVLKAARNAYRKKLRMFDYPTLQQLLESIREDAFCPELVFSTHEALGTGSKLTLQKMGNMDLGFNTGKSNQFMQVRNIFEDPNEVQFWIEAAYGVRIRDVHAKVFKTNEQTNVGLDLAGDYVKAVVPPVGG